MNFVQVIWLIIFQQRLMLIVVFCGTKMGGSKRFWIQNELILFYGKPISLKGLVYISGTFLGVGVLL